MFELRLKELRKEYGMNQTELAKRLGIGRTTVTEYEAGRIQPPIDKLQQMAKIFGVSVNYLMGESNSKNDEVDVEDVVSQLNKLIDDLKTPSKNVKFDGKIMDSKFKKIVATQLEQVIHMSNYITKS